MAAVQTRKIEPDEAGMRLDRWFKAHYPDVSFAHLQKLLRSGQVRVDGGRVKANTRLEPGQAVRVPPLERAEASSSPRRGVKSPGRTTGSDGRAAVSLRRDRSPRVSAGSSLESPTSSLQREQTKAKPRRTASDADFLRSILLHEDDQVFVFNKPPGLAVQGGSGLTRHLDALLEALTDKKGQKPRLVHRLDRDTSGVLVVARTRLAASALAGSFRSRSSRKIYWALVKGLPKPRQGRISTWLAKEGGPEGDRMRIAAHGTDDASHAVSLYSVVENAGGKLAWLTMRPVTGRTHQLRAHAAHIGHPIIGDPKYFSAEDEWTFPGGIQNKLHLHALRIVIPHPAGGTLDISAPLPLHMQQSWNLLGFDATLGDRSDDEE
jgi:23S rRNA pseudouridine955/2504/2580 synthase